MIEIISATRKSEEEFWKSSATGISLRRLAFDKKINFHIEFSNGRGLPEIYNERIIASNDNKYLVFMHDDVWIEDLFFSQNVVQGLAEYDIIGVAGNRRRIPFQPSWCFIDSKMSPDKRENLSGTIAHGMDPFGMPSHSGPAPAECELLDGVFLAAKKSALLASNTRFDPIFNFHFYDLDFCRTARKNKLRLGTWPISLTHQSPGLFNSVAWKEKYQSYMEKWKF